MADRFDLRKETISRRVGGKKVTKIKYGITHISHTDVDGAPFHRRTTAGGFFRSRHDVCSSSGFSIAVAHRDVPPILLGGVQVTIMFRRLPFTKTHTEQVFRDQHRPDHPLNLSARVQYAPPHRLRKGSIIRPPCRHIEMLNALYAEDEYRNVVPENRNRPPNARRGDEGSFGGRQSAIGFAGRRVGVVGLEQQGEESQAAKTQYRGHGSKSSDSDVYKLVCNVARR
jgi:hypothetical protein